MATNVGINGFGRIGRNFYRAFLEKNPGFDVVAVNDLASPDILAHMLRYDSTLGVLDGELEHTQDSISVDGKSVKVLSERSVSAIRRRCRNHFSSSLHSSHSQTPIWLSRENIFSRETFTG